MDISKLVKAPLTARERNNLKVDAEQIRATAERKGCSLDKWDEHLEVEAATQHFELGCWLFYFSRRISRRGLETRIDCARRIFIAGLTNPGYQFFTIFDFGERDFDNLFEMGDGKQVIAGLRCFLRTDTTGNLLKAFAYMGWPVAEPDLLTI